MIRTAPAPTTAPREEFWDRQLGYVHAFVTIMMALTLGLAMHQFVGYRLFQVLPASAIGIAALLPLLVLGVLARNNPGNRWIRWITGIPFAMMTTGAVGLIALAGGIVPGSAWSQFGLESLWQSWPFQIVSYLLVANLVGSSGRRSRPLTYTNIVYLTSHLGLALALMGGAYGSLSLERRTMVLFQGMPTSLATNLEGHEANMPFKLELRKFHMDQFAPNFILATLDETQPEGMRQVAGSQLAKVGMKEVVGSASVEVLQFLPRAEFTGKEWKAVEWPTAGPAAEILVKTKSGKEFRGWVASGSVDSSAQYLAIAEDAAILMNQPRPKAFKSDLLVDGKPVQVGV
ncbi:MAG: hypothetical protein ACK4NQ_07205, partial [Fimbriimonadaceae bacterium]